MSLPMVRIPAFFVAEMTVSEIAYLLGYEQPGNFSTAFKKSFGVSPLAVRRYHVMRKQ